MHGKKKRRRKKCEHFFPCSKFNTAHKNGPWHEEYAPCYVTVVAQKFNRHHQHFKPRCALTAPAEACTAESYLFYLKTLSWNIYTHFITISYFLQATGFVIQIDKQIAIRPNCWLRKYSRCYSPNVQNESKETFYQRNKSLIIYDAILC